MREFPDIIVPGPDYSVFLWLLLPIGAAAACVFLEFLIEHFTEKYRGKPTVGVGFVLMGAALLAGASGVPLLFDEVQSAQERQAVAALEENGFTDVRLSFDAKTFGAYYEGELMRGALIPDRYEVDTYRIVETPPGA
ncbi:membrane protein [Microbacterium phage Cece]|nr:membrane protein [Microbacterium phage Cece]